ncbi:MAG: hypothetical protein ACPGVG_05335 [Mycobacterium sp.]
MTDLTTEELREACEMAGLEIVRWGDGWAIAVREDRFLNPEHPAEHLWIEARCASLLVAKVGEKGGYGRAMWFAMEKAIPDARWDFMFATDPQRIRACIEVLRND